MVLKRKLPTQQKNKDIVEETKNVDDFDMELEENTSKNIKAEEGHDIDDSFPDQIEDAPEDFIPEELRALEDSGVVIPQEQQEQAQLDQEQKIEKIEEKLEVESEFDDFDISFDQTQTSEPDPLDAPVDLDMPADFESENEEIEDVPGAPIDFEENTTAPSMDFETQDQVDWKEVEKHSSSEGAAYDSFENTSWDDNAAEVTTKVLEDRFDQAPEPEQEYNPVSGANYGVVPEIPGLDSKKSDVPEFMGVDSQELNLNNDAKKKLLAGIAVIAIAAGAYFIYPNIDKATEVTNRWSGALTEVPQNVPETKEEQSSLIEKGVDITPTEDVIDFSEISKEDSAETEEFTQQEPETQINLLEPEVVEKTASGKEIIKANGDEEIPEDVEEGVNLIASLTEEIEKQKHQKGLVAEEVSEEETQDNTQDDNAADMNKKVDEQLAQYRKLLAEEEDPGKKIKPGAFFANNAVNEVANVQTKKVVLADSASLEGIPDDYVLTPKQVDGHQIVAYPDAKPRKEDPSIRTLDHFRSLLVEKQDQRVRMPRDVKPALENQGFPEFKVISIVPNYGLIGEHNGKKGILMIGDSFKGWELVGVYASYAEFKSNTKKHIITLR